MPYILNAAIAGIVSQKIFGKLKTVKMMDDDGKETTLQIPKGSKIKIGYEQLKGQ